MLKSVILAILYFVNLLVQVFTLLLAFSCCHSCSEEGDLIIVMQVAKEKCILYLKNGQWDYGLVS